MDTIFVSAPTRARLEKIGSRCEKKRETDDIFVVCTGGQRVQYFYQGLARGGRKATRVEPAEGCVCGGVGCQGAPTIEGFEWGATPRPLSIGCLFTHLFPFVLLSLSASSRAFFVLGHPDARVPSGPGLPNQTRVILLPGSTPRVCRGTRENRTRCPQLVWKSFFPCGFLHCHLLHTNNNPSVRRESFPIPFRVLLCQPLCAFVVFCGPFWLCRHHHPTPKKGTVTSFHLQAPHSWQGGKIYLFFVCDNPRTNSV